MDEGRRTGWFRGETPKQLRRQAAMLRYPIRYTFMLGAAFGFWMGTWYVIRGADLDHAALVGVVSGVLFGPTLLLWTRRSARLRGRAPDRASETDGER